MTDRKRQPIGVFDSGLGGLTVLKSLKENMPNESFIYFGDTAHVPYGSKSKEAVIGYSEHISNFLVGQKVKLIIIACNTASAVAADHLQKINDIPIFEVVIPCIEAAVSQTSTNNIGIIGTQATISSGIYSRRFKELASHIHTYEKACPLFVPLAEEGWAETPTAMEIAKIYLSDLIQKNIDTLVLGCTHYPLLYKMLRDVLGDDVILVSSGSPVARVVSDYLYQNKLQNDSVSTSESFYVTDYPQKFDVLGSRFLGHKLTNVHHISLT